MSYELEESCIGGYCFSYNDKCGNLAMASEDCLNQGKILLELKNQAQLNAFIQAIKGWNGKILGQSLWLNVKRCGFDFCYSNGEKMFDFNTVKGKYASELLNVEDLHIDDYDDYLYVPASTASVNCIIGACSWQMEKIDKLFYRWACYNTTMNESSTTTTATTELTTSTPTKLLTLSKTSKVTAPTKRALSSVTAPLKTTELPIPSTEINPSSVALKKATVKSVVEVTAPATREPSSTAVVLAPIMGAQKPVKFSFNAVEKPTGTDNPNFPNMEGDLKASIGIFFASFFVITTIIAIIVLTVVILNLRKKKKQEISSKEKSNIIDNIFVVMNTNQQDDYSYSYLSNINKKESDNLTYNINHSNNTIGAKNVDNCNNNNDNNDVYINNIYNKANIKANDDILNDNYILNEPMSRNIIHK